MSPRFFALVPFVLVAGAVPALAAAAESTATYPVGAAPCGGTAPACEPAQDFYVTTDGVLRAEVEVTFTCPATTVYFSVDGTLAATSAPVPAGGSTGVVDLGPVAPGAHTLTVAAAVPLSFSCDSRSWTGTLAVTTGGVSDDDVAFVPPGGDATVSTLVAGSPRPAGITATLYHAATATATARIAVATYDGLPSGIPTEPHLPPPTRTAGYLDLQLTDGDAGDSIAGQFYPEDPLIPPNPVIPPNPIRLAYWDSAAWSPVFSALGSLPTYSSLANVFSVTFDSTSTPAVTALGGTVFAAVTGYYFQGFGIPVDADTLNGAKAGRAIPLKWRVFDYAAAPVGDLDPAVVKVTSVRISCDTSDDPTDPLEEYATGASGLQNLGAGAYQLNWATLRGYAGTCRRVRLDLGERNPDGTTFYRTADFEFTR